MVWQDVGLMIAGFVFAPSLLISIKNRVRYPVGTTLPTAIALTAMVVLQVSLGLRLAALSTGLTTLCWYILLIRR